MLILEPKVFGDARGFFFESFNRARVRGAAGIDAELRAGQPLALGAQRAARPALPDPSSRRASWCASIAGEVFDVAVDLRRSSPTFGRWVGVELSAENQRMIWIPPGFAHGFLVLSERAEFLYKTTDYYAPEHERTMLWNDPDLGIAWPLDGDAGARGEGRGRDAVSRSRGLPVKILVTGATARSGGSSRTLLPRSAKSSRSTATGLDLADRGGDPARGARGAPDVIVNAAAYTAVDQAETEPELAIAINGVAPGMLAEEAKRTRRAAGPLLHRLCVRRHQGRALRRGRRAQPAQRLRRDQARRRARDPGERLPHLILRTSWVYAARGRTSC